MRKGAADPRVAIGTNTAPNPMRKPQTISVGPTPIRFPTRSATSAPMKKPALPMERIRPMAPALSPRSFTANSRITAWPIMLNRFSVPVHARSGRANHGLARDESDPFGHLAQHRRATALRPTDRRLLPSDRQERHHRGQVAERVGQHGARRRQRLDQEPGDAGAGDLRPGPGCLRLAFPSTRRVRSTSAGRYAPYATSKKTVPIPDRKPTTYS